MLLNVHYAEGMADSARVRNLFEPLLKKNRISIHNLVHVNSINHQTIGKKQITGSNYRYITYKWYNPVSIWKFYRDGAQFIRKNKRTAGNVLYHYDAPDIKNLYFILYARVLGYKIILDIVEDNRYQVQFTSILNWLRVISSRILLRCSPFFTDTLIGISNHLFKRLKIIAKGKVPVYLLPISVDFRYFNPPGYTPDEKNIRIFYGGSFAAKDGIAGLINAFDRISKTFSGVSLILTGLGLDADVKKYLDQVKGLENGNRIVYLGFMKTDEYYKVLNQCDIFCMTRINSKYANAGFPFKLGEFLAAGKAVIATRIGDVPQYLEHNKNALIIDPDSEDQLVEALTYILSNIPRIGILGAEARKVAESHFDSEKTSSQLLQILQLL